MITEKDSANVSLAKIANAFLKKSHEVIIYALYYEKSVLRFFDKRILRFPLDDLTEDMIHTFDIVFASSVANSGLINKNLLSLHKIIWLISRCNGEGIFVLYRPWLVRQPYMINI